MVALTVVPRREALDVLPNSLFLVKYANTWNILFLLAIENVVRKGSYISHHCKNLSHLLKAPDCFFHVSVEIPESLSCLAAEILATRNAIPELELVEICLASIWDT